MTRRRRWLAGVVAAISLASGIAGAQRAIPISQRGGAIALGELVAGLGRTTRVLMIGAHPDDEDTFLLAWLARGQHVETAYLSLTRGEGGQNLIGNELGTPLGMIRTQELLAAGRVDGAHQYFTRAIDFGFSKTDSETFTFWPKDTLLEDMVRVIRAYRPQIIISVWTGTPADGHGHHQAAGLLARDAFAAAGDSVRFPAKSTSGLPPWTPLKFYQSVRGAQAAQDTALIAVNVGEYDPLIGKSYSEIASESRSQHLSQGMGMLQQKGAQIDHVRLEAVHAPAVLARETSMFSGLDTSWRRFAGVHISGAGHADLDSLSGAIIDVQRRIDLRQPEAVASALGRVTALSQEARGGLFCQDEVVPRCPGAAGDLAVSLDELVSQATSAYLQASGVAIEVTADRELVARGDSVPITIAVYNRGHEHVVLQGGDVTAELGSVDIGHPNATILPDSSIRLRGALALTSVSFPWWLSQRPISPSLYGVSDYDPMIEGEDRVEASAADLRLLIGSVQLTARVSPVVYRFADPARGEIDHPIAAVPAVSVLLDHEVEYARAGTHLDRMYRVRLASARTQPETVHVTLRVPRGASADTAQRTAIVAPQGVASLFFRVHGTLTPGNVTVQATAIVDNRGYTSGFVPIDYQHITPLRYYRAAVIAVSVVDVTVPPSLAVAYVPGVGDNVEPMLEELGIPCNIIDASKLAMLDSGRFTTLVIGPRAYGANDGLRANAALVRAFAARGGTVVVQYGQTEMTEPGVLPFPIALTQPAARVTDEQAPVTVLDPSASVLRTPNRITQDDFDDWVQERASYMPSSFDSHYDAVLSMHDPGDSANAGALLVTHVGKGTFIYTTLSFFRQLPAGNAGAARLFVNLMSAGLPAVATHPGR